MSIGKAHVAGFDDKLAGPFRLLNLQPDITDFSAAGLVGGTHLLQAPDAPFVSCSAGLYPFSDPGFFLGQFFVEDPVVGFFDLQGGLSFL